MKHVNYKLSLLLDIKNKNDHMNIKSNLFLDFTIIINDK